MNQLDKTFALASHEVLHHMMREEKDFSIALARYCASAFGAVFVSQQAALERRGHSPEAIAEHLSNTAKVMKDYIDRSARITESSK